MTEFETLTENQDNLLGCIYKLFLKYDTETEQIKNCVTKWMQNFKEVATMEQL